MIITITVIVVVAYFWISTNVAHAAGERERNGWDAWYRDRWRERNPGREP